MTNETFLLMVDNLHPDDNGCKNWIGTVNPKGYGAVYVDRKTINTHRLLYKLKVNNNLTRKIYIRHKCDNPMCVTLEHLIEGTHQDNMNDRMLKNRGAKNENNGNCKLSDADVLLIREEYAIGKTTTRKLGEKYSVTHGQICNILCNRNRILS